MLEVRDLHKRFGRVTAVARASFTAANGSITGLVGENGAGKSTTLAMMCGLLEPDEGSIHVDRAASGRLDRRRQVGALLDHKGLYPRLTAQENIAYFGALRGLRPPDLAERVHETLMMLDLGAIANRRTEGFSQGERMKVALARAMVHSPRNLLLDEPTNGLDMSTARNLRAALKGMRDRGMCIVLSSHVLEDIRALCDNVVLISKGRTVAQGTCEAICASAGRIGLEDAVILLTTQGEARHA